MAPLTVDPTALDSSGAAVVAAGENLGSVTSTLTSALGGLAGMAGDDPAGAQFGRAYDQTAATVLQAMAVTRNGLSNLGDGVRMTAHNYSLAEAMSDVAGRAASLPVPKSTSCVAAASAPSAIGNGDSAPPGWGWVAPYIGMIWPNGDSGKLRAAAAAWRNAGAQFAVAEIHATAGPMAAIRAQQLPEAGLIEEAFSDAYSSTTAIVGQCQTIATGLEKYAAHIDSVHAAILDLLSRICDPLTGIKEVWEFLTDEDEDEIARIAHDIAMVVDNFSAEVDALGNEVGTALAQAKETITTMGRHAAREWNQFLHGNPVGWLLNFTGQRFKGMGKIARGLGEAVWNYNEIRAVVDPVGFGRTAEGALEELAPLVGLGGDHAPGVLESWKQTLKDTVHWDDWARNPAEAYGELEADVAMDVVAKGPSAKADQLTDMANRLKALRERLFGRSAPGAPNPAQAPTSAEPKAGPPERTSPPTDQQPQSGSPTPGPQPKPGSGDSPLPKSPTESKTPVENKPATGESTKPASGENVTPNRSQADESATGRRPVSSSCPAEPALPAEHQHQPIPAEASPPSNGRGPGSTPAGKRGTESWVPVNKVHPSGGDGATGGGDLADHSKPSSSTAAHETNPGSQPGIEESPPTSSAGEHPSEAARNSGDETSDQHRKPSGEHQLSNQLTDDIDTSSVDSDYYPPGSLPSYEELRDLTRSEADKAFYWSGRDVSGVGVGPDGSGIAEHFAGEANGTTLEMLLEHNGLKPLPRWNELDPESVRFWEEASAAYADNATGTVTAIVGCNLRPGNVWQTIEIPRLIGNLNVTKIIQIDPDTGLSTVIFER
ncbi:putative nAD(+)--arginine ADP-ribosyltransferase Mav [Mycobacterium kansasii 662]|uniref:Outer membrane channel protein CpnT-like N-terminal domain-containing protein n=2 Tax=Mycobacterium kansasii TaxID=1768 RepID=A0A653EQP0_MYCKA|nr:ADP-ribosyltransferse [Mycobacterium kansasii]EUA12626.1 putative nAD(+)--arginine ADP-ribosyltransferase Mav [Mycobacterium kansasii 662]VAZ63500.1 Outer membrane channel protein CpnT [Mycobacterium kansasii]VAZ64263.1 Outer membrane channel protein CpnT [Mycobacterium kansasii]VAZ70436.1 Outer membrane channel protein CpnT [Mycobacterium kansasii]VTO99853.1 hypothetical protein BIN_B_02163 [Mycobacterium kansasii]